MRTASTLSVALLLAGAMAAASYGQGRAGSQSLPPPPPTGQSPTGAEALDPGTGVVPGVPEARKLLGQLVIDKKALAEVDKLLSRDEADLSKARAEIRILQAKITRAMLETPVDLAAIKALVKESLDWELQVRMIQIQRQIDLRKILGDGNWETLFKLRVLLAGMDRAAKQKLETLESGIRNGEGALLLALIKRLE